MKILKISQDYGGYFTGNVPQHGSRYLGTSAVDAGQITAMFGRAPEAIRLVNQFDSNLLKNVSFIFNFAKSGAYGVYLSELDRAMKTDALRDELQKKGYRIDMTENGLTASTKEGSNMTPEAVQQDIDAIWSRLSSMGGMPLGINMAKELDTAKSNAAKAGIQDPEGWQWMAVLNIGGTIVHEAVHAKGSTSEGPSEEAQAKFVAWALPQINEAYRKSVESQGKGEEFRPLKVTGEMQHASSTTWYKTAQLSYYFPQSFTERPMGSDLQGRFPFGLQSETGMSPWSMMAQEGQSVPTERKLGRQYMSPIPRDLSQEHDSIEEQLRKYTREDKKLDPKASMNELLSEGWDADRGYITLEGLLDEKRPKPLMVPLQKTASDMSGSIKWIKEDADDQFYKSVDGRFEIEPTFNHTIRPSGYRVRDNKTNKQYRVNSLLSAKDIPNQILSLELEDPNKKVRIKAKEQFAQSYVQSKGWDINNLTMDQMKEIMAQEGFKNPVSASSRGQLIKQATLFGWMNNLSISDGSTIPGLGDRVMAWDDRDEDFSQEESWIKEQPRYNPTYDIKGFFYRWIEPRFQPQPFDSMTQDYSNTHPAKRFATSVRTPVSPEIANILSVLNKAKSGISSGRIASTRFIVTDDVMPLIERSFPDNTFKVNVFHYGNTDAKEEIFAVWVSHPNVSEEKIERVEKHLQNKTIEKDVDNLIDNLTGISKQRGSALQEVLEIVKDICESYGANDFSVVGSYPRDLAMKSSLYLVDSLEFRGSSNDQCIKIGSLAAEKLGAQNVELAHNNLAFNYKGISVNFSGDAIPAEIKAGLESRGLDTSIRLSDLYNRDFTVNMLAYDLAKNAVTDPTGEAAEDIKNRRLRTILDANYVCKQNPIIILRALKLKIRHKMNIDQALEQAMVDNIELLFDGRYSDRDLLIARENVRKEGKNEAEKLFQEFGLGELDKIS